MEKENAKTVIETLSTSLDDTQKNATNTEKLVQQVLCMTGCGTHNLTVSAILADGSLNMEKKLEMIHLENADYDQRLDNNADRVKSLQDTQSQNTGKATDWWSRNWGWVLLCGAAGIAVSTPKGRKVLKKIVNKLAA